MPRIRFAVSLLCAGLFSASAEAAPAANASRITGLTVSGMQALGPFGGIPYRRVFGTVKGIVDPREAVAGLAGLPKNAAGQYEYASEFEIIEPAAGQPGNEAVLVDSENRCSPVTLNIVNETAIRGAPRSAKVPAGLGNGFLQRHRTSYARVQWQTKLASGVPENAQGIGLVVMRDFARLLSGATPEVTSAGYAPSAYRKLILSGKSQSAWFVNAFVAEGFNADPVSGKAVFQGALSLNGLGYWMAINNLAAEKGISPTPYIDAMTKPMQKDEMLRRPATDPFFVDVAMYTDFYRLRASLTSFPVTTDHYRRYDLAAPHGQSKPPIQAAGFGSCNDGKAVALNPLDFAPYARAQILGIEKAIGVASAQDAPALPQSVVFQLGPPPAAKDHFNPMPGADVKVPLVDANAMPLGGVRMPDVDYPLGKPVPASVAPVFVGGIDSTCGNRGQFQPFSTAELNAKYGSKEKYLALYGAGIQKLIAGHYLLAEDERAMLSYVGYLWDNADRYVTN